MSSYFEKKAKQAEREDKPSWRELDARKDKSPHGSQEDQSRSQKFQSQQKKQQESKARQALDELFTPKKNATQAKAWQKVDKARGKDFEQAALEYINKHGLPRELDDLIRLLDLRDAVQLENVLEKLGQQVESATPVQLDLIAGKLAVSQLSQEDPDIIDLMEELAKTISQKL